LKQKAGKKKAIALSYEQENMPAPKVIAKGFGYTAEQIVDRAEQTNVPVIEDDNLAQILCPLEIGEFIPEVLYQPVAKILSFVIMYKERQTGIKKIHRF
jgi:flagellar biosynthesis protein